MSAVQHQCAVFGTPVASSRGVRSSSADQEDPAFRVARLYAGEGGALLEWLFDECRLRGQQLQQMSRELGVTYGYINQLRSGIRQTANISQDMAEACARYLGVPTIVAKVLAGQIRIRDFAWPNQSEEELIERAFERMLADPSARQTMPHDARRLPLEAKKTLVLLYSDLVGRDVLGARYLPEVLTWLQRATEIHNEAEVEALRGKHHAML